MVIIVSYARTHVEGGRWKNTYEGKGKLKEKKTEAPSSDVGQDAFIEVPLNQLNLHITKDMRRDRKATTP